MMTSSSQWFTTCVILLGMEIHLSKYPECSDCNGPTIEEATNRIIVLVC